MSIQNTLAVKGLRIPRLFIWLLGFFHGRCLRTAKIDENGVISSGYITGQLQRYKSACINRRHKADIALTGVWLEADRLILEIHSMGKPATCAADNPRQAEINAKNRQRIMMESANARNQLSQIRNTILNELKSAESEMAATKELLLSTFSCYAHGVSKQPVGLAQLPRTEYESFVKDIIKRNVYTLDQINEILNIKEGGEENEVI